MDSMKDALQKLLDGIKDGSIKLSIDMAEKAPMEMEVESESEEEGPEMEEESDERVDASKSEKAPSLKGPSPTMEALMDGEAKGREPRGLREIAIARQKMKK